MRTRYQRGSIRINRGRVYGTWRGDPIDGHRKRMSVYLGKAAKGKTRQYWLDQLAPHIREYYESLKHPRRGAGMTLAQFVEAVYLPAHEPNWSPNTRASMRGQMKQHVLKPMGERLLVDIAKADIVNQLNGMRAKGYSKRSLKIVKWLYTSIFEEALDNEILQKNPCRRIGVLKNMPDSHETRPLTEDEVRLVFAATAGESRLIWRLLIGCGLRPGELCALRRCDVADALRVDESIARGQFKGTKTRKTRLVPLSESLRRELDAWLENIPASPQTLLFTRTSGRPMSVVYLREQVQTPTRAATGIKDLTLRQARATFATLLQGDVKDVQELLGHSTAEMTLKHYKKAIPDRQTASVEELDRRLMRPALKVVRGGR